MTAKLAPNQASEPTPPAVGIFWLIEDVLVVDRSIRHEAEPYGDCVTHAAGHYERWQEWQAMGPAKLKSLGYPPIIVSSEYDEWPRGRVVYDTEARATILYADRRIQKPRYVAALQLAYGLAGTEVRVRSDAHYR